MLPSGAFPGESPGSLSIPPQSNNRRIRGIGTRCVVASITPRKNETRAKPIDLALKGPRFFATFDKGIARKRYSAPPYRATPSPLLSYLLLPCGSPHVHPCGEVTTHVPCVQNSSRLLWRLLCLQKLHRHFGSQQWTQIAQPPLRMPPVRLLDIQPLRPCGLPLAPSYRALLHSAVHRTPSTYEFLVRRSR